MKNEKEDCYPTELVEKAKFELHIFGRVSVDTGEELLAEVEMWRALAETPITSNTDGLRVRIQLHVKRELFSFHTKQEWVNKAQSRYANCGVRKGFYITLDADGRVMHMGKCEVNHGIFENFIAFFQKQAIMLAHRNFVFGE